MNDADMLEYCHIGIAVGNAKEGLKAIADEVCDDIAEDGIYKTMKNINLYKKTLAFFQCFFIRVNVSLKWSQVLKRKEAKHICTCCYKNPTGKGWINMKSI